MRSDMDVFERNPDPALDEIVELAAVLCNADYAYLGSLDQNRLWFKSVFGFRALEQPRWSTGCQRMLELGQPLLIADTARDGQFPPTGIPVPGAGPCRSYAGTPSSAPTGRSSPRLQSSPSSPTASTRNISLSSKSLAVRP